MDSGDLRTAAAMLAVPKLIIDESRKVAAREGGLVNDPVDPGGITNHGISIRYGRSRGLMWDLDGDGDVDADDIRLVSADMAAAAFILDFYLTPRLDLLPAGRLAVNVWDMAVNAGPSAAVKILQDMLNRARATNADLVVDGQMGPATARAVGVILARSNDQALNATYSEMRKEFYRKLIAKNAALGRYINGWTNRANEMARV